MGKPCVHEVRGGTAQCNGGGYDGCACGPYTVWDLKKIENMRWRTVGNTQYAEATADDIVGATVLTVYGDDVYLEHPTSRRKFKVSLGKEKPFTEYREV